MPAARPRSGERLVPASGIVAAMTCASVLLVACGAEKRAPATAAQTEAPSAYAAPPGAALPPEQSAGASADHTAVPPAAPPPPTEEPKSTADRPASTPSKGAAVQGSTNGGASSRAAALLGAARELEASQRALDVAAGDCQNACRALGSMERATGHICELAAAPDETRRCVDAKGRVYSARDRVRTTCGECPGGPSVDRGAPIPSVR